MNYTFGLKAKDRMFGEDVSSRSPRIRPLRRSSGLPIQSATSLPGFSGLSAFSTFSLPGGGPSLTNFRVQFYRGALQFQSLLINEMGPPVLLPALFVVLRAERLLFPVTDGVDKIPLHSSRY